VIHAPTWKILLRLARIPSEKNAELVVTCEHGPRARLAKGLLNAIGYKNIALLAGHMSGWRQAGLPQEKYYQFQIKALSSLARLRLLTTY